MITAFLVIVILVALIVAHEFGHFIAAKMFGVRVDEFGVGYPPRAFLLGTWGGTEYTLNWIPFGGFVRLYGEDEKAQRGPGSLVDAPRWKQAVILVAGVAANALIALMLFILALHVGIPRVIDTPIAGEPVRLIVSDVVPGSPADAAGIKAGNEIVGIADADGTRIIDTLTPETVTAFVRSHPGEALEIDYLSAGEPKHVTAHSAQGVLRDNAGTPALGVGLVLVSNASVPWGEAIKGSIPLAYNGFTQTIAGLWHITSSTASGDADLSQVVGPVGLASVVGEAARNGFGQILLLAGLIGINLAIINLIPIPVLDGGRLLVVIIEAILRKPAPRLVLQILNTIGVALIILLMITVTYNDIARLLA
jgi:regulator of sigma E protease